MTATPSRDEIEHYIIEQLAAMRTEAEISEGTQLYDDGIALDSLDAAALSAAIEDRFGIDPLLEEAEADSVGDLVTIVEDLLH